jgi:hypothetical protein
MHASAWLPLPELAARCNHLSFYPNSVFRMKKIMYGALALFTAAALMTGPSSCKKSDDNNPTCQAGDGGNTQVVVYATINGDTVMNTDGNDTVYVKYGTTVSPGTDPSAYDKAFAGEAPENHIHITRLSCGSYYLYRTSYDPVSGRRYTGGTGISFTKTSGEVDTVIALH